MALAHTKLVTWLLYNVQECPGKSVTAPGLYAHYKNYCELSIVAVPATKDTLAQCITKLYPKSVRRRTTVLNGQRCVQYDGLTYTSNETFSSNDHTYATLPKTSSSKDHRINDIELHVPPYCTVLNAAGYVTIHVPTLHMIDAKLANMVIHINISAGKIALLFHDIVLQCEKLGISEDISKVDSHHILALINLVEVLPICTGVEQTDRGRENAKLPNVTVNSWSQFGNENDMTQRVRSKACLAVRSFNQCGNLCDKCRHIFRWNRNPLKRKERTSIAESENDTIDIPVPPKKTSSPPNCQSEGVVDTPNMPNEITPTTEDHDDLGKILMEILPNAPPSFKALLESQVENLKHPEKDPRSRRWDMHVIKICLSLFCQSPKGYKVLRDSGMLVLPSERLLRYYKNSSQQEPGSNQVLAGRSDPG